jgi:iron complex outermembrane receptor protein
MLTYADNGGKWSVQAYVRNIEDTKVITVANANFGAYNYAFSAPRTFGTKLSVNWYAGSPSDRQRDRTAARA